MQTWEAITARRNVRSFDGRPAEAADLDRIYPAGRPLAPIKTPRRRLFDEVVHRNRWAAPDID